MYIRDPFKMKYRPNKKSLAKVGVEVLDQNTPTLKCKTCGRIWIPKRLMGDESLLVPIQSWWICPDDPRHTVKPDPESQNEIDGKTKKELEYFLGKETVKLVHLWQVKEARARKMFGGQLKRFRNEGVAVSSEQEEAMFYGTVSEDLNPLAKLLASRLDVVVKIKYDDDERHF